jgi:hypothetical protein
MIDVERGGEKRTAIMGDGAKMVEETESGDVGVGPKEGAEAGGAAMTAEVGLDDGRETPAHDEPAFAQVARGAVYVLATV